MTAFHETPRMSGETEQNAASANPQKLLALAERCQTAAVPNFQLEQEIGAAVFPKRADPYPPFTASLDAAMTLVPHPAWVRMDQWPMDFCHGPVVSVQPIRKPQVDLHAATGSTLPLALCAAALRARATLPSPVKVKAK